MKYWVQFYNEKGDNWIDSIGCTNVSDAIRYASADVNNDKPMRVIMRTDTILQVFNGE